MVVGNGLIANQFSPYKNSGVLIFASGVSNSNEENIKQFLREEDLLRKNLSLNKGKLFVYFSSCDVENPKLQNKAYYKHKIKMEKVVADLSSTYFIVRLPQVVGINGNPNTLVNYIVDKIKSNSSFYIFSQTKKNIIDIKDVFTMVDYCINNPEYLNKTCNIVNTNYISIIELVKIIENFLGKKAIFNTKDIDITYKYSLECSKYISKQLKLNFDDANYFFNLLRKYF